MGQRHTLTKEELDRGREIAHESVRKKAAQKRLIHDYIVSNLSEQDVIEICDGAIARAKKGGRDFEILRDTLGEKPGTETTINVGEDTLNGLKDLSTLDKRAKLRELLNDK